MKKIKIYGERNSGTHFLEHLVHVYTNNEVIQLGPQKLELFLLKRIRFDFVEDFVFSRKMEQRFGWKHGCPPIKLIKCSEVTNRPIILTITKNPYSFLISLYDKPYHYKGTVPSSFSEFIRENWICRKRDNVLPRTLSNPVMLWNVKNEAYLKLAEEKNLEVYNMKYEELLEAPSILKEILSVSKDVSFGDKNNIDQNMIVKSGENSYAYYRDYYLNEKWKERLSSEDIEFINRNLNVSTMNAFGYSKLS